MTKPRMIVALALLAWTLDVVPLGAGQAPPAEILRFEASFWTHLHHFLYVLGRAEAKIPDSRREAVAAAPDEAARVLATAAPEDVAAWRHAVSAYAAGPSRQDAVFDSRLARAAGALTTIDDGATPSTEAVPADMRAALLEAAPVYRRLFWPAHRAASEAFIERMRGMVAQHGAAMLATITAAVGEPWPEDGYPVQVAAYSNWAGAYSTVGRLLVVASQAPGNTGTQGLEIVFHEAMHQWDEAVDARLAQAAAKLGVPPPPELSHALIFFTAGEAARMVIPGHTPYAELNGIWKRGRNARYRPAFDAGWQAHVRRPGNLDAAFAALVEAAARPR